MSAMEQILISANGSLLSDNQTACTTTESSLSSAISSLQILSNSTLNSILSTTTTAAAIIDSPLHDWQIALICICVAVLSLVTVIGNLLVLISFKVEKRLQTVSNHYLLSLAVADLTIGLVSMPLYTMSLILDYWPLGPVMCDLWLCIDYTMSNASVANLLIICFDRYMSVSRPLQYMAKRTPRRAGLMIACAWIVSFMLWTPWIVLWPYIDGQGVYNRTVPRNDCYIQFLVTGSQTTSQVVTVVTSFAAFYLPVTLMIILYCSVFRKTRKRQLELKNLQATTSNIALRRLVTHPLSLVGGEVVTPNDLEAAVSRRGRILNCVRACCEIDDDYDDLDSADISDSHGNNETDNSSQPNKYGYPSISSTSDAVSHKPSLPSAQRTVRHSMLFSLLSKAHQPHLKKKKVSQPTNHEIIECITTSFNERVPSPEHRPSVMDVLEYEDNDDSDEEMKLHEELPNVLPTHDSKLYRTESARLKHTHKYSNGTVDCLHSPLIATSSNSDSDNKADPNSDFPTLKSERLNICTPQAAIMRNSKGIKRTVGRAKKNESKQDSKAAKTLSAILLAFICTWSPYMLFTLINTFNDTVVPKTVYSVGYWLCYINSTVNPMCYALCNINFRLTFTKILKCEFWKTQREANLRASLQRL